MAYLVIALGVLMALAGGYLLNYGYSIVQVERGWSSVIAGSVFLAGGLITACLGLVIRALSRLGSTKETVAGTGTASLDPITAPIIVHEPVVVAPTATTVADLAPLATEMPFHDPEPVSEPPEPHADHTDVHRLAVKPDEPFEQNPPPEPVHPAEPEPEPHHDPEPAPTASDHEVSHPAPPMDDWLDRAFSDLDQIPPPRAATPPLTLEPERVPEPAQAEIQAEAPAAIHEPDEVEPTPHGDAAQSAVIGRYESDGTSYVMYADGSIEAQSAAGVYRFSSMAELKSFIEG